MAAWFTTATTVLVLQQYASPVPTATFGDVKSESLVSTWSRTGRMKVREIDARDVRNLDKLIAAGTLLEGRPVGELLMHYDAKSEQLVPDANAAFLFITREGSMGVIETTDRIIRTADLTGIAASPSSGGVGFHKGVQFNLKAIIPEQRI